MSNAKEAIEAIDKTIAIIKTIMEATHAEHLVLMHLMEEQQRMKWMLEQICSKFDIDKTPTMAAYE
jgi:predicted phage tail protein